MSKSFATKALNSTHVSSSKLALYSIDNWKRGGFLLFHGGLSKETLFFMKEFIEACIQGGYSSFIHEIGLNTFEIISQFHKKLISFSSFMNLFVLK